MQRAFILTLLTATALCPPAHAQRGEDEIVVTATRADIPTRNLPADVTVIDTEAALSRGQTTIAEALDDTPGLGVVQSGGLGQQTSLFTGGANSYHTLVLFDGIRLNDPTTPNSSFDAGQDQINGLSRIEVVEGPMSAVFGSDAIGGVINMIPRHGGDGSINARLDFAVGSFDTMRAAAAVDGTLGRFRYAVTSEGFATEGFDLVPKRMATHTGSPDGAESAVVTAVFDLELSPDFSLDLLARRREASADIDVFDFEFTFPFREYRDDSIDAEIAQNDLTVARLGATWRVSDAVSMRATTGGIDLKRAQNRFGVLTDGFSGERRFADLTLNWRPSEFAGLSDVAFVAGVSHEREDVAIAQGFGFPPPFAFTTAEQEQSGVFVTTQGAAGSLTLTAAARLDDHEGFGEHATWRVGASLEMNENARIYASLGTSFRAPSLYERFSSAGAPDLDPEQGESVEIGGTADVSWAAFDLVYRHTQLEDMIDFLGFNYANIDKARIETIEARVALRPTSWLTLRGGYIFTDAQDTVASTPLLRRPEDTWLASADITHGAVTGRLSWRSVGEREDFIYGNDGFGPSSPPYTGTVDHYNVVRVSLGYELSPNAQAYIAADNALDETFEAANGIASPPRAITVGLRLRGNADYASAAWRPSVLPALKREDPMAVAKVIEVTAGSKKGLEDAIQQGLSKASDSLENIEGAWIQDIKVNCKDGKISEWRVNMKVTFVLN